MTDVQDSGYSLINIKTNVLDSKRLEQEIDLIPCSLCHWDLAITALMFIYGYKRSRNRFTVITPPDIPYHPISVLSRSFEAALFWGYWNRQRSEWPPYCGKTFYGSHARYATIRLTYMKCDFDFSCPSWGIIDVDNATMFPACGNGLMHPHGCL